MHAILVPVGSHGDVHPLVGLGLALRSRGHRVTFVVGDYFKPLIRGLGFATVGVMNASDFQAAMRDPDLWHPSRGFHAVARMMPEAARAIYGRIVELNEPGETVVVGATLAFGARLAQEKLGVPTATVHLQPGTLHSNFQTPIYGGVDTNGLPRWARRAFFKFVYARMVNPHFLPGLNAFRAELGLPPARDVLRTWLHSPELTLGFFPSWFGPPQPDWPAIDLVGFPLYDERDATPIGPDLAAFLDAGPPPIAFTPGSANLFGRAFFEAAAAACVRLGRRGLLLTRFPEQVPPDLPDGVIHVDYAPFSQLLPRVAALVHHGGVGTAAQAMAAGVPQLIWPLAHDQFDNAARMERLGIARSIVPSKFRGPAAAKALAAMIEAPAVLDRCRAVAARFAADPDPMGRASDLIEALAGRRGVKV